MTTLKDKVLKSLQRTNEETVKIYTTNDDVHINELNEGIEDLFLLGIYPRIKDVTNDTLEFEFVPENFTKLRVGTIVKFKDEKYLRNQEYDLQNKFFVKSFIKGENDYEVTVAQFVGDDTLAINIYDVKLESLEDKFEILG